MSTGGKGKGRKDRPASAALCPICSAPREIFEVSETSKIWPRRVWRHGSHKQMIRHVFEHGRAAHFGFVERQDDAHLAVELAPTVTVILAPVDSRRQTRELTK